MLKVLGREFEGEPFFKRVSLNKRYKYCYISITVIEERFSLAKNGRIYTSAHFYII